MTEESVLIGDNLVATQKPDDTGGGGGRSEIGGSGCGGGGSLSMTSTKPMPFPRTKDAGGGVSSNANDLRQKKINGCGKLSAPATIKANSDSEDGFLSTSPDSANGETSLLAKTNGGTAHVADAATKGKKKSAAVPPPICLCTANPSNCVTLKNILDSFKAPLSEEQAWSLIYQFIALYRRVSAAGVHHVFNELEIPEAIEHISLHRDGTVHCSWSEPERKEKERKLREELEHRGEGEDERGYVNHALLLASHKKILRKVAVIVYTALDYNLQADEQCQMSPELEELITYMTADDSDDDCIDEGIDEGDKRWDDENDDDKFNETKEFDYVLEACRNHVKPTVPEDHYKAVCRALVTETIELRIFLQQVLTDGADNLHLKVDSQTSKQELAKLGFNDWARFWVQVIDELRRGVRLKKNNCSRTPTEYELTPYEILMEDIRTRKYQLRKVMVNGDIPPRVKKDAHALILEFIRSRPPLKKASERKLPPPIKRTPSPREQLMDSIRKGQTLKHIQPPAPPRLKDRLLPPPTTTAAAVVATLSSSASAASVGATVSVAAHHTLHSLKLQENMEPHTTPRSKQRLIKVDFSLLKDDDTFFDDASSVASSSSSANVGVVGVCSQPKMPPYPIGGYMVSSSSSGGGGDSTAKAATAPSAHLPAALTTRVLRRTKDTYTEDEYHRFFDNALESYDLATQCESRRASLRRHTIVGCQSNFDETHSMPPSRPESRQSDVNSIAGNNADVSATKQLHNNYNQQQQQQQQQLKRSQSPGGRSVGGASCATTMEAGSGGGGAVSSASSTCSRSSSSLGPWNKSFLDEKTWHERGDDRLSLTLEEIVHIRSVMTKAELEGLPVGVRVKEDVEKRKVCFLCLRTRFSIFGPWGIQCKLCQRTVCSKCYTKMRIPSEHFRNVPLVLISPSLLSSPAGSSTPSPSHQHSHAYSSSTGNILDETFPKSLIERLLRSESERKTRNSVGSAPSSPKHQRSNMSTPGGLTAPTPAAAAAAGQAVDAAASMTSSYTAGTSASANNTSASYGAARVHTAANGAGGYNKENAAAAATAANNKHISIMSRSMEGPRSLPVNSPARPHSNSSTLDRKSKFSRAFTLSSSGTHLTQDQKENMRGEQVPVCHDCKGLVMEITRSSKQTRSSARNRALKNLTLDLSPVYK